MQRLPNSANMRDIVPPPSTSASGSGKASGFGETNKPASYQSYQKYLDGYTTLKKTKNAGSESKVQQQPDPINGTVEAAAEASAVSAGPPPPPPPMPIVLSSTSSAIRKPQPKQPQQHVVTVKVDAHTCLLAELKAKHKLKESTCGGGSEQPITMSKQPEPKITPMAKNNHAAGVFKSRTSLFERGCGGATAVDMSDPQKKKLVNATLRSYVGGFNEKANQLADKFDVVQDKGDGVSVGAKIKNLERTSNLAHLKGRMMPKEE